jgi:hypothetical protein
MIDPFTAFALAQGAVAGIKKAVALGKDINSLIGEFSQFYHHADEVHRASITLKVQSIRLSDAQIGAQALQLAMASKALRDYERELKDILFWSGNAPVWQEMMAERKRMLDERTANDARIEKQKQKDRELKAQVLMSTLWIMASLMIIIPLVTIMFNILISKHT